jgi:hypothetical protein
MDAQTPTTSETIWRYMDLTRFVGMMASKSMWFTKASQFSDDPYEGFCQVGAGPIPSDDHGPGLINRNTMKGRPIAMRIPAKVNVVPG